MQLPMFDEIEVQMTKGYKAIVDPIDSDLSARRWTAQIDKWGNVYARRQIDNVCIYMHRLILERILNRPLLRAELVDHIDGNGLNNRRSNLRLASTIQNAGNAKRNTRNLSGYKGVRRNKRKWQAYITVGGASIFLGGFDTPVDAHEAYKKAAVEYFGEFARFE